MKGKGVVKSKLRLGVRERRSGWVRVMEVGRLCGGVTNLAPSHFSFSGFEPDEKRVILYPLWELVFSDQAKV